MPADRKIDPTVSATPSCRRRPASATFPSCHRRKPWMAARSLSSGLARGAAMTELLCQLVIESAGWYNTYRPKG